MGVGRGSAHSPSPTGCGPHQLPAPSLGCILGTYLHLWCLLPPGLLEPLGQPWLHLNFLPARIRLRLPRRHRQSLVAFREGGQACPGLRWGCAKSERPRTGLDPTGMPSSIWSRTMKPWSSSACGLVPSSRMSCSQPVLLPWATRTWDHTPSKPRG